MNDIKTFLWHHVFPDTCFILISLKFSKKNCEFRLDEKYLWKNAIKNKFVVTVLYNLKKLAKPLLLKTHMPAQCKLDDAWSQQIYHVSWDSNLDIANSKR